MASKSATATDLQTVREKTKTNVRKAAKADSPVLIEAPPVSGKTTSAYELALTDDINPPLTYLAGRHDLYQEAIDWAEQQDDNFSFELVPNPYEDCPTFPDRNDDDNDDNKGESTKADRLYQRGYSGRQIHWDLGRETVYTPCINRGCEYLQRLEQLRDSTDEIDLIIGHHQHSLSHHYVDGRIVVIDEFNQDPFVDEFSPGPEGKNPDPGEIIDHFLDQAADEGFPTEHFGDVTDILIHRDNMDAVTPVFDWFRKYGATPIEVRNYDFYDPPTNPYDPTHLLGPLLTLALFCMRQIEPGIALAPPPANQSDPNRIQKAWEEIVGTRYRCIRDRNTNMMKVLQPPDLTNAEQVIGLDAIPTPELWDLVFAPDVGFEHNQVIKREDFKQYLRSALNMSIFQIGGGMYHYADGQVSSKDEERFQRITEIEDQRFALITTKQALKRYEDEGVIEKYVKQAPTECDLKEIQQSVDEEEREERSPTNGEDEREKRVRNFAKVLSSNVFECEELGVVSGTPHPGDDLIQYWAGFCGQPASPMKEGPDKSYGDFGDKIYHHFVHHIVVQAILRFGRHECVWNEDGATVYVNTKALPDWFTVDAEFDPQNIDREEGEKEKKNAIIEEIIRKRWAADREAESYHNRRTLVENLNIDITKRHVWETMQELKENDLVASKRGGKGGEIVRWNGDERLKRLDEDHYLLPLNGKGYIIKINLTESE